LLNLTILFSYLFFLMLVVASEHPRKKKEIILS